MKKPKTLEEMTHSDILMGIILFKKGNQNFLTEELKKGLRKASKKYPTLGEIKEDTIYNIFFFQSRYLSGEMNLPHYRLSNEGKEHFRYYLLDRNNKNVMTYLEEIAEKVWGK